MNLGSFFLFAFIFFCLYLQIDSNDEHKIVKRNRFKMKDKSVVYNNSMEDEESAVIPSIYQKTTTTTLKPVEIKSEEDVSDVEREIQRLAEQMKKGVEHINMDEYINEEDSELGINDVDNSSQNSTISTAASTLLPLTTQTKKAS